MLNRLFLLLFLTLSSLYAQPTQATLDLRKSHSYIGESMSVYEDSSTKLNFEQVSQLPLENFSSVDNNIFSSPFSSSTFWYTFTLNNPNSSPLSRLMVFEAPWLDYIQINIVSSEDQVQQYEVGNTFEYSKRSVDHHFINQRHTFSPGVSRVYIQVKTRDPFVFATSILDENDFLVAQLEESKYTGIIYGILIAMLLYNLLVYLGIREPYFAYYVLFVLVFLIMNNSYNGYLFQVFHFTNGDIQNWLNSSSIFLFALAYILFAKSFLDLKMAHNKLNTVTNYAIYSLLIIAAFSAIVGGYRLHVILSIILLLLTSIYIFSIAIYSWQKGNRSARFFILGSIGGLSGSIITSLTVMGQLSYSNFMYKAVDYGMLIDAILLSLALADRIKLTHEEKNIAEMERTIAEAESILAKKESKTDVLTGLMNRRAYYEITEKESNRSLRYHVDMSIIIIDIDYFKEFNDNYGHALGDMVLKHFAKVLKKMKRDCDYAFRLGGDEFLILLPHTSEEEAVSLAERIQDEIRNKPLVIDSHTHTITISCGVSQEQKGDTSIDQIEKRADTALYRAKDLGKNTTVNA